MKTLLLGSVAALTLAAMSPAGAADVPVAPAYKALPVVSSGAFYIWADGSAQEVNLPTVGLGLKATATTSPFFDQGAVSTFNPRVDGWGTRGAIGYILPPGTLPSGFGANVRIEVGASYVKASDTESDGRLITNNAVTVQNLNGALSTPNAFICFGATFNCTAGSSLANDFSTWDVYGKVASDVQIGPLTMTRSWAVFGGQGRSNQTLSQTFNQFNIATGVSVDTGLYASATALSWTDFGTRTGVDFSFAVNSWLSLGVGGYFGLATRRVSLNGSDFSRSTPNILFNNESTVAANSNITVGVGNAEAGFTVKPLANVTLRGFAGAHFDGAVPGVSSPTFSGSVVAPTGTTPAGIKFQPETSYYAGGGLMVRFAL